MSTEPTLQDAVARLHDFRHVWNPGDVIDEESGLRPEDLDIILGFIAEFPDSD